MEYLAATGVCTCLISVLRMRTSFRYEHCFLIKLCLSLSPSLPLSLPLSPSLSSLSLYKVGRGIESAPGLVPCGGKGRSGTEGEDYSSSACAILYACEYKDTGGNSSVRW